MPSDRRRAELKAFIKLDKNSQPVSSVLLYRKSMPKVGRWKEVPNDFCCDFDDFEQLAIPTLVAGAGLTFITVGCGTSVIGAAMTLVGATQVLLLANLMSQLAGAPYSTKGTFAVSADGKFIRFTPVQPCPVTSGGATFGIGYG